MKTHYAKRNGRTGQKFDTSIESILYQILPDDCLLTKNEIQEKLNLYFKQKPSESIGRFGSKELDSCIFNLCQKGYLKEIFGIKLEKFIKTLS
jgi:hypothetical protein